MNVPLRSAFSSFSFQNSAEAVSIRAQRVADVAARHALEVDRDGRFPAEAIDAARAENLLGALVPRAQGGEGASTAEIVDACYVLGRACAATAMIFAMHHIKAACVVRHSAGSDWHAGFMRRMVADQLLLASSTTEGQNGGDVRNSEAPVMREGDIITLDRAATVMSYGAQADAIVTTARRAPDALPSDQVLVVFEKADYELAPTVAWETLGMRGTCSRGFAMKATGVAAQILPQRYSVIHTETMTPNAHLMWSAVWAGIAASAAERARLHLRQVARRIDQVPNSIVHLHHANARLASLRATIAHLLTRYEAALDQPGAVNAMDFQAAITLLKVDASEHAVASVMASLRACGLSGYREDGPASLGRHLRDILASPVMINNDRIMDSIGMATLLVETPRNLTF